MHRGADGRRAGAGADQRVDQLRNGGHIPLRVRSTAEIRIRPLRQQMPDARKHRSELQKQRLEVQPDRPAVSGHGHAVGRLDVAPWHRLRFRAGFNSNAAPSRLPIRARRRAYVPPVFSSCRTRPMRTAARSPRTRSSRCRRRPTARRSGNGASRWERRSSSGGRRRRRPRPAWCRAVGHFPDLIKSRASSSFLSIASCR